MSLTLLEATLTQLSPDRMSEDEATTLETMLELPAFAKLSGLIEAKIEDYYEWLRQHPKYSFDGKSAKEISSDPAPSGPTVMQFHINKNGIAIPVCD